MLEAMESVRELWQDCRFVGLCDVTAPFCGPEGATAVYGPQKGVKADQVAILDERFRELAGQYRTVMGRDVLTALWAVLGGDLKPGADAVLDILRFEHHLEGASLVITGEGRIDNQTLQGKLPSVVARRAKAFSPTLRVIAMTGRNELTVPQSLFDTIIQITPDNVPLEEALDRDYAYGRLAEAGSRLV